MAYHGRDACVSRFNARPCRRRRVATRRSGRSSRTAAQREELARQYDCEIDEIHSEFLTTFKPVSSAPRGIVYSRYSTDMQKSVADLVRRVLELARAEGIPVARTDIFFDVAVSGKQRRRAGLDLVMERLETTSVLYQKYVSDQTLRFQD